VKYTPPQYRIVWGTEVAAVGR